MGALVPSWAVAVCTFPRRTYDHGSDEFLLGVLPALLACAALLTSLHLFRRSGEGRAPPATSTRLRRLRHPWCRWNCRNAYDHQSARTVEAVAPIEGMSFETRVGHRLAVIPRTLRVAQNSTRCCLSQSSGSTVRPIREGRTCELRSATSLPNSCPSPQ